MKFAEGAYTDSLSDLRRSGVRSVDGLKMDGLPPLDLMNGDSDYAWWYSEEVGPEAYDVVEVKCTCVTGSCFSSCCTGPHGDKYTFEEHPNVLAE